MTGDGIHLGPVEIVGAFVFALVLMMSAYQCGRADEMLAQRRYQPAQSPVQPLETPR